MEDVTAKAMEHFAKLEAAEPKAAPEPTQAAEAPAQSEAQAQPESAQAATEPTGQTQAGEQATKAPSPAEQKRILKALIGGQVREVDEDTLVKLADRGYDYETKASLMAEEARRLEALIREVQPYKEKVDELKKRESEQEEADPFLSLQKEHKALKEQFQRELSERKQAAEARGNAEALARLNSEVATEQAKFPVFSTLPDSMKRKVAMNIYGAIAYGRKPPAQAVAEEAADLQALASMKIGEAARKAISKSSVPSVPGRGSPPTAPASKMGRKSLYNGDAYAASMDLLRSREAKGQ